MEEVDKKIHAISTPYGSPILKNIQEKARKDFIDKSIKAVSFLGLVTKKQYKKLLEANVMQTEAFVKVHDNLKTDLAYASEEIYDLKQKLELVTNKLTKHEIMTTIYQYLKGEKIDISYEDFVLCFTEQMDDIEMLEPLMQIARDLKFGDKNE